MLPKQTSCVCTSSEIEGATICARSFLLCATTCFEQTLKYTKQGQWKSCILSSFVTEQTFLGSIFFTKECCLHGNTEENLVGRVVDTVTPKSTLNIVQTYSALPECSSGFQVSSENARMIKHILSRSLLALHC